VVVPLTRSPALPTSAVGAPPIPQAPPGSWLDQRSAGPWRDAPWRRRRPAPPRYQTSPGAAGFAAAGSTASGSVPLRCPRSPAHVRDHPAKLATTLIGLPTSDQPPLRRDRRRCGRGADDQVANCRPRRWCGLRCSPAGISAVRRL